MTAAVVFARAGLALPEWLEASRWAVWAVVAVSGFAVLLNLITPNGIGGTALQLDYLHKQGVPLTSGASAMVLSGLSELQYGVYLMSITSWALATTDASAFSLDALLVRSPSVRLA